MGRPPAYVFVVRHGKRLDAADKQWHLSTPTPYDPPLTYGGWMQSRTVGARIASMLEDRAADDEAAVNVPPGADSHTLRKKKRYRIIIHSSPFVRCLQTSIAIAAGIAANPAAPIASPAPAHAHRYPPDASRVSSSPPGKTAAASNHQHMRPDPSPTRSRPSISTDIGPFDPLPNDSHIARSILRLDPFLGEWLSPDYFEHITPPPKSSLMLATAKAELLRRENYDEYPHFYSRAQTVVMPTPGQLWSAAPSPNPYLGSPLINSTTPGLDASAGLESLSSLKDGLPTTPTRLLTKTNGGGPTSPEQAPEKFGYTAPMPAYAVSSSQPIPPGYVSHARDNCINIDYQWDSSRGSMGWGDGGTLPEEWASMHQRFRRGLKRMVDWYTTTDCPGEMVTKTPGSAPNSAPTSAGSHGKRLSREIEMQNGNGNAVVVGDDDDEFDVENVVILVSHGAGCNALIGAVTQQPVLADVAMSSITTARRRPRMENNAPLIKNDRVAPSLDEALLKKRFSLPEMYEMVLFASTEHLQSVASTPNLSRSSSAAGNNGNKLRLSSPPASALTFGVTNGAALATVGRSNSVSASLGSMRKASGAPLNSAATQRASAAAKANGNGNGNVSNGVASFSRPSSSRGSSFGLWRPRQGPEEEEKETEEHAQGSMHLDFSLEKENQASVSTEAVADPEPRLERQHAPAKMDLDEPAPTANGNGTVHSSEAPPPLMSPAEKAEAEAVMEEERDLFDEDAVVPHLWAGTGNGGLWGAPRPPDEAERLRDHTSSKRRWTVVNR